MSKSLLEEMRVLRLRREMRQDGERPQREMPVQADESVQSKTLPGAKQSSVQVPADSVQVPADIKDAEALLDQLKQQIDRSKQKLLEQTNERLDHANKQFEQISTRLDQSSTQLEQHHGRLERVNEQLEQSNERLNQANTQRDKTDARLTENSGRLEQSTQGLERVHERLTQTTERVDQTNERLDQVRATLEYFGSQLNLISKNVLAGRPANQGFDKGGRSVSRSLQAAVVLLIVGCIALASIVWGQAKLLERQALPVQTQETPASGTSGPGDGVVPGEIRPDARGSLNISGATIGAATPEIEVTARAADQISQDSD